MLVDAVVTYFQLQPYFTTVKHDSVLIFLNYYSKIF